MASCHLTSSCLITKRIGQGSINIDILFFVLCDFFLIIEDQKKFIVDDETKGSNHLIIVIINLGCIDSTYVGNFIVISSAYFGHQKV